MALRLPQSVLARYLTWRTQSRRKHAASRDFLQTRFVEIPSLICSFRLGHLAYLCQRSVADRQEYLPQRLLMHAAVMQRKHALDLACRCVEDAYQAREGPALQHAAHFRAFG